MTKFANTNINVVDFLKTSVDNGYITIAQAVQMGNMVEMVSMETIEAKPNSKRVVNANSLKYEQILGVQVVKDPRYSKFWEIMNRECTRTLIEDEIKKQRNAGFSPYRVVVKGYRVVVKVEKSDFTSKYKNIKHGKLQRAPFTGLSWEIDKQEHGFHIDLNHVNDNK